MRKLVILYSVVGIWTIGWLAGTFGIPLSIVVAVILCVPPLFAWEMATSEREIKRRECVYLAIAAILAVTGTAFVVNKAYEAGADSTRTFYNECRSFHRYVLATPEYRQVRVSYDYQKGGGCVYLRGRVADKGFHEQLIKKLESMVRYNDQGYRDRVHYPGKPDVETEENAGT